MNRQDAKHARKIKTGSSDKKYRKQRKATKVGDADQRTKARPFLRWAGGRRLLASKLLRFLPPEVNSDPSA
jgi:hypothetical protein